MLIPMPRKTGSQVGLRSERPAIPNHLVQLKMKVSRHHLESRQRFINIVVRVRQHGLLRCVSSVALR